VEAALPGLTGTIRQRPPAFSAIKLEGQRAYTIARAGGTVELAEREVTVHRLELVSWDDSEPDRPVAMLDVECSAGTYIRALARDLGATLGPGAYLGALTRTASGPFRLQDAVALDDVRAAAADGPDGLRPLLRPVDTGLDDFPEVRLTESEVFSIARGQFVRPAAGIPAPADRYRLVGPGDALVAIAAAQGDRLAPDKVFVDATAASEAREPA
jgi:tRNA pseudouridine55 synthase